MPAQREPTNASGAAAVEGHDHLSNLPDGVLQHMLSFLPTQDAVRTCVLAKSWHHLWRFATGLRFVCSGTKEPQSTEEIQALADHLLRVRFREGTPLDTCEFCLNTTESDENKVTRINFLIRIALQCKVRMLHLAFLDIRPLGDTPIFISQYLKKLKLDGICEPLPSRFLDFSWCPVLEDLEIALCFLSGVLLISSQSLKRLTIKYIFFDNVCRMPICTPNLVSLCLVVTHGKIPSLERMPSLQIAHVHIYSSEWRVDDDDSNKSILLQGLSEVQNLSLMTHEDKMFIFRRELKFCSTFNKLKSLLLDGHWREPADFSALACLLKLCPVLEKLTIELYSTKSSHLLQGHEYKVETKLNCNPLEISAEISRHLKIVVVKSQEYDQRLNNVLEFLTKQIFHGRQGSA